jgi:RNA polymerase sigma-70 factor (ECF subfamily)
VTLSTQRKRTETQIAADAPWATSEARLIEQLRGGDNAAYDELVRVAGGRMLAVARRMMSREEDAQDAVQEAFLSAFKNLGRFDGRSQLTTWLHRITVNACLMKLRSQRRRPERAIEDFLPTFVEDGHQTRESTPWKPNVADGIEGRETRDLVRAKINELPEGYRIVLMLRDIEELSTEDTANALGMTENAVKTRLHRARQALRTLLDPHFANTEAQ